MSQIADIYAGALLRVTHDEDAFCRTAGMIMGDTLLWSALSSPAVRAREKVSVLRRLTALADTPLFLHFYELLAEKDRLSLLPEIIPAYHELHLREQNMAECTMRYVTEPTAAQKNAIEHKLCILHHKAAVNLLMLRDPSLIGGFTLELEGVTYDKSVRGQLRALKQRLHA